MLVQQPTLASPVSWRSSRVAAQYWLSQLATGVFQFDPVVVRLMYQASASIR